MTIELTPLALTYYLLIGAGVVTLLMAILNVGNATRAAGPVSAVFGRLDALLRRWPAAAMSLLSIALLFGVAIVAGG